MKLLNTVLLLGGLAAAGCGQKNDPGPAPDKIAVGSYKIDGRTVTCRVTATVTPAYYLGGRYPYDALEVTLVTTPQPATGYEEMYLNYEKSPGQPNTAYKAQRLVLTDFAHSPGVAFPTDGVTLRETGRGGFSGTFSGKVGNSAPPVITEGVFTNVGI